ncbi:ABC transporter substrate-binding protein [Motilibacter aurantiacus]|uniref:ABC transporter substrate-binding protein n=1 Tax=Motilibacter aurantiacus TaxID=2714955 RepID=UPI00140D53F3|nr:ABC transporter substrate-binding protein [Motilibacter aurantiacus]NHC46138.1 carbohydrate ABC transporter substrate-binding protein [Motilibacter aurantiacus]
MRRLSLVAGIAALGLALAGCGGDGSDTSAGDTGSNSGSGTEASGEVEVFTWWTEGGEKAGLDGLVKVFGEKYPNLKFVNGAVAGGAGSNAKAVLASRLQTQDPPDTFQGHAGGELSDYIKAGQLEDLSDLYQSEGWSDIFPKTLIDAITYDGKLYSVPANVHRANVVWANPTVLEKAGVDPTAAPESIADWITDLDKVKASGVENPLSIATDWTQVQLLETVLIADLKAEGYAGLWTGDTKWDSPEVTAALNDYAKLMSYTNSNRSSLDWPDAANMVRDGKAGYNVMGDWVAANWQGEKLEEGKDYVYMPVPGSQGIFDFLSDSFTLPVGAKNPEGAKDWLRVVGSAEGQQSFNTVKGSIPARTDADAADYPAYQQSAIKDFSSDTIVPSLAHGAAASIAWLNDITSAVGKFGTSSFDSGAVSELQSGLVQAASNNLQS